MNVRIASAALLLTLATVSACSTESSEPAEQTPAATSSADNEDEPTTPVEEAPEYTAEDVAAELRTQLGLAEGEGFQSADATSWAFYIADVALPEPHLLRVTMQTDGDDPLIEGSSRAILSLVGRQFPELDFVEVMDAGGVHVEQTSRREVPLLNQ